MTNKIIQATESDILWLKQLYLKYADELNCTFEEAWKRYVNNPRDFIYVYQRKPKEYGFIHFFVHQDNSKSIRELAVSKPGVGLGRELIDFVGPPLIVATYSGSKAEKFYRKCGFYEFGKVLDKYGSEIKEGQMPRELTVYAKDVKDESDEKIFSKELI